MDKIRQYIPKDIPVISPKGDEIQVGDSFFKEMLEKGYGRDYDIEATQEPVTLEFYQAKPAAPFSPKRFRARLERMLIYLCSAVNPV